MTTMRRHKADSSYPRGEETRARIIRTAIALFGEKGFSGVTTREIAARAEVPAPSLQYYFDNKEGLYAACMEDIQAEASRAVAPALARLEELLAQEADIDRLIDAYCAVQESLADFLFAIPDADSRALFIARQRLPTRPALAKPDPKNSPGKRIHERCIAVIRRIAGDDIAPEEIRLIATTIGGQLLIVHLMREHIGDLLGWKDITPAQVGELKRVVRRQTTAILNSYRRE